MKNGKSGFASIVAVFILIAFLIVLMILFQYSQPKPSVEVEGVLQPSTVNEGQHATLILKFKNVDLKTHEITVIFNFGSHIVVYEGNEQPLHQNTYNFILEAADPSEQRAFGISGTLDSGTISAQYQIAFSVSVDKKNLQKHWNDLIITIQKR